jgi:hypothetical protein
MYVAPVRLAPERAAPTLSTPSRVMLTVPKPPSRRRCRIMSTWKWQQVEGAENLSGVFRLGRRTVATKDSMTDQSLMERQAATEMRKRKERARVPVTPLAPHFNNQVR